MDKKFTPKTANTFSKVCELERDNLSFGPNWISIEENHVNIYNQKSGHEPTGSIRITKKAFDRFIKFYQTGK